MKLKRKSFKRISSADFTHVPASEEMICKELITDSCIVELEGNMPVLYLAEDDCRFDQLVPLILEMKFNESSRRYNKGMPSALSGALNQATAKDGGNCIQGAIQQYSPQLDALIKNVYSKVLDKLLATYLPGYYMVSKIRLDNQKIVPDFRMGNTISTSCIVNLNSPFTCHKDTFNVSNVLSTMIGFKHEVTGGHLVFPEYGIGFAISNRSVISFDGYRIFHGVTPITKYSSDAYRISMVFYAAANLGKCQWIDDSEYEIKIWFKDGEA